MPGKTRLAAGWKARACVLSPPIARERGGEIDLIMRDGTVTVFIEVRYRRSARYGDAAASVTPQKQQRLLKAARLWLCRQNGSFETVDCRFDVVAFTGNDIQWLKNAFGE